MKDRQIGPKRDLLEIVREILPCQNFHAFCAPCSRKNSKQSMPLWNTLLGTKSTYYMCCLFNAQSFHLDMSFGFSVFASLINPCIAFSSLCDMSQYVRRSMIAIFFSCHTTIVMYIVVVQSQVMSMDCSTPGFPDLHPLPEFAQTHVRWVDDAIQPSHPLLPFSYCLQSFPASGSFPMSQLFWSGGQSIGASASPSVRPVNIQSWFPLGLTGLISLLFKRHSRVFPSITVQKHQFFSAQLSLWSNSHIHTWLLEKP